MFKNVDELKTYIKYVSELVGMLPIVLSEIGYLFYVWKVTNGVHTETKHVKIKTLWFITYDLLILLLFIIYSCNRIF